MVTVVLSGIALDEKRRKQGCVAPPKPFRETLQLLFFSPSAKDKAIADPKIWASSLASLLKRVCDHEATNRVLIGPDCPTDPRLETALIAAIKNNGLQPFELLRNGELKKI